MAKKENKVFVYIIEDWRLYWKEIKEKELENFVYYRKDDLIIVNKDYNKVKPLVRKLLEKQNILRDYWKMAFLGIIFVWVFVGFVYFMLNFKIGNVDKKVNSIVEMLSWNIVNINNIKDNKELIIKNWKVEIWTWNLQNNRR